MNKTWLKAAAVRAVKTMAQSALAVAGASALITEANWAVITSTAAMSGVLSILTSIAGLPEVKE